MKSYNNGERGHEMNYMFNSRKTRVTIPCDSPPHGSWHGLSGFGVWRSRAGGRLALRRTRCARSLNFGGPEFLSISE